MFCTKCGCRIPSDASKCPDCGSDRPNMEYCSGFWLELNQNTQANTDTAGWTANTAGGQNAMAEAAFTGRQDREPSGDNAPGRKGHEPSEGNTPGRKGHEPSGSNKPWRKGRLLKFAVIAEGAAILLILMINALSGMALKQDVKEAERERDSAMRQLEELKKEYDRATGDQDKAGDLTKTIITTGSEISEPEEPGTPQAADSSTKDAGEPGVLDEKDNESEEENKRIYRRNTAPGERKWERITR